MILPHNFIHEKFIKPLDAYSTAENRLEDGTVLYKPDITIKPDLSGQYHSEMIQQLKPTYSRCGSKTKK